MGEYVRGGGHVLEAPCGAHVELPDVEALELKHKQHTSWSLSQGKRNINLTLVLLSLLFF